LGRIIGLIGCTCLVIVALRLTNLQHTDHTLKGGEDRAGTRIKLAPREHYKLGKEAFLRGRYPDAVQHLEAATASTTGLTAIERRQADGYLGRARTRLQAATSGATVRAQSDPAWATETDAEPAAADSMPSHQADATRNRVEKLMKQANAALEQGNRPEAVKLAQLAHQVAKDARVRFAKGDESPAEFLFKLKAPTVAASRTDTPDWARDDLIDVRNAAANDLPQRGMIRQTAAQEDSADFGPANAPAQQSDPNAVTQSGAAAANQPRSAAARATRSEPAASNIAASSVQEQANALIAQAREDIKAGRYDEARHKALLADQLDATYSLFEDRPELVVADVDRLTGSTTLARDNNAPKAASRAALAESTAKSGTNRQTAQQTSQTVSTNAGSAEANRKKAVRLLELARKDIANGNLDAAQSKAEEAAQINVAYKLFEDMPELVLTDIAARRAAENVAQGDGPNRDKNGLNITDGKAQDEGKPAKAQAKALLAKARQALEQDRVDEARQLAIEADRLKASYDLFDDRPDLVLADVARSAKRGPLTPGTPIGNSDDTATVPNDFAPNGAETATADAGNRQKLSPAQAEAIELLRQARQLIKSGRFDEARQKAEEAGRMNVTFPVFADRPDLVLSDLNSKTGNGNVAGRDVPPRNQNIATASAQDVAPIDGNANPFAPRTPNSGELADAQDNPAAEGRRYGNVTQADSITEIGPGGSSASELYRRGMQELNHGNRAAAYSAFLAAHQTGQKLDYVRAQRLQDYLRELAPRTQRSGIQLTNNTQIADGDIAPTPEGDQPAPLDAAQQEQMVKFDRIRSDVLNSIFKAERLRKSDPEAALAMIDQALSRLEGAEIPAEATASLMKQLTRTRSSLQSEIVQQQPNIELNKRNKQVRDALETQTRNEIRIEQEFAKLVEEYNELYKQQRYAEAEVVAKKAKELNPKDATAESMKLKALFARRVASNAKLQDDRERSYWEQLDEVEQSVLVKVGDKHPVDFGDDWDKITKRRKGKYRTDNRKRGEEELRIEQSLSKRISLHEEQVPLAEVMKKIQAVADINIVLDTPGLEEEGVNSDVMVSINVDGIMVKSALNLILGHYNLGYMIDNEVLKITSRMRQQGELVVATYSVADLVIPIPDPSELNDDPFIAMKGFNSYGTSGNQANASGLGAGGQGFAQVGANQDSPFEAANSSGRRAGAKPFDPDFSSLTELISSTIAPDSWDSVGGPASMRSHETTLSLVIRQTQKVHEEIADLLDQLRRLQDLQVTIEVRFVTVSDRFFERIGVNFNFNLAPTTGYPTQDNSGLPLQPFGSVNLPQFGLSGNTQQQAGVQGQQGVAGVQGAAQAGVQGQQAQAGVQGQQAQGGQQGASGLFGAGPSLNLYNNPNKTSIVGLQNATSFTQDLSVPFQQGSFTVGVPTFGNYNPQAGMEMGLAILSDIEAFFFIQAAQGDQRNNLMFAPKVTVFNGQTGTVMDNRLRPFVTGLQPTVGFGAVGFAPQTTVIPEGVTLSVTAVVSSDRRFVRLSVMPAFRSITDVFTFTSVGGNQQGGQQRGGAGQNQQGGQGGFGGGQFGGGGQQGFGIGGNIGGGQFGGGGGGFGGGQQQRGGQGGQAITVQQPVVETVTVITTVSVPDGGTVLLGGIKRLKEGRNMAGVPILNKIPYVSRLFKNTGVGRETESLLLMITPRIIIQEEEEELLGLPRST
jgi:general secretion pathway protein D